MPTLQQDQRYFQAGIQELKEYLLSKTLFWPLAAPMPRLTIGGLLLAQKRLQTENLGTRLDPKLATLREKWRAAWEKKAAHEFGARFNLWKNYLDDYHADPETYAENYAHEIRWRVMLDLLERELSSDPAETEALLALDKILQIKFVPGDFIWDKNLETGFSQSEYWFLYGRLKGR